MTSNLFHLFLHGKVNLVLLDEELKETYFEKTILPNLPETYKKNLTVHVVSKDDFVSRKFFFTSALRKKYDITIVHPNNAIEFTPVVHLSRYTFIPKLENVRKEFKHEYLVFKKLDGFYDGVCFQNPFESIIFDKVGLTTFEQTWVRDKPYRFLRLTQKLLSSFDDGSIVEIGSVRKALSHKLHKINPLCCNDSHSTFFWCQVGLPVHTVDIQRVCQAILEKAYEAGMLETTADLNVHVMDGLTFLRQYDVEEEGKIRLLFLDAWDVMVTDKHEMYAKNHLDAYKICKNKLHDTCFILIDDTDIAKGGKGKVLIPELLKDGFTILCKGRQTLFYRGPLRLLWKSREHDSSHLINKEA